MLDTMDFDQLTRDLGSLTKMAEASRDRLAELAGRAGDLREELQQLLDDAEPRSDTEPPTP